MSEILSRGKRSSLEGLKIEELVLGAQNNSQSLCCAACGKIISGRNRRQRMQYHLLAHSGQKNHQCPHCPYKALLKFTLDRHIRAIHKPLEGDSAVAQQHHRDHYTHHAVLPSSFDGEVSARSYAPTFVANPPSLPPYSSNN